MSKSAINFLVDLSLLAMLMLVLATTGVVRFVFPSGSEAEGWTLWGFGYDTWTYIQAGAVGLFALGVLLHLILHWTWVCGFVWNRFGRRRGPGVTPTKMPPSSIQTLYGAATLMAVLTALCIAVGAAEFSIIDPGETTLPASQDAPSAKQTD